MALQALFRGVKRDRNLGLISLIPSSATVLAVAILAIPNVLKADLLVSSQSGQDILRFDSTGKLLGTFVSPGSGGLLRPGRLIFGPDGNLYAPNYDGGSVLRYNGTTGTFIDAFIPAGSGGLIHPNDAVFGPDGNFYVADYLGTNSGFIRRYNGTTGAYIGVFSSGYSLVVPSGLTFGPDGSLYVADDINVIKFNGSTGAFISVFAPAGSGGLQVPVQLAYGSDGNLYVASAHSGVLVYNGGTGAFIKQLVPDLGSAEATSLAFGPDGDLYVGFFNNSSQMDSVLRYDTQTGALIDEFIPPGVIGIIGGLVFTPGSSVPLAIQPTHGGNAGTVTVQITSPGLFKPGVQAALTGIGPDIIASNVNVSDASLLSTTFNLKGTEPGMRTVVITNPNGASISLPDAFTVEQGGAPQISVDIIGGNKIRIGSDQTYYLSISNRGSIDAPFVEADLNQPFSSPAPMGSNNSAGVLRVNQSAQVMAAQASQYVGPVPVGNPINIAVNIAGVAGPCQNAIGKIRTILATADCALLQAAEDAAEKVLAYLYSVRLANLVLWETSIIPKSQGGNGHCFDPAHPSTKNFCDALALIDQSNKVLIDQAQNARTYACALAKKNGCPRNCIAPTALDYLGADVDSLKAEVKRLQQLFSLSIIPLDPVKQEDDKIAVFLTQALRLPTNLVFPPPTPPPLTTYPPDGSSSLAICPVSSLDPNDLMGDIGFGQTHWVSGQRALNYAIYFANENSATAPAQSVLITDQIDGTKFDLSTLAMEFLTFGGTQVSASGMPLAGNTFTTDVDLRPGADLIVHIIAALDLNTGVLTCTLSSLDPVTGQPPTDSDSGFLPPGVGGSLLFTAMSKRGVPTDTVVTDSASIVFDANSPLMTPIWSNTIDNMAPISQVATLPGTENTSCFRPQWSGSDTGSGLASFTTFASDNGAPYTPWLTGTSASSAVFKGQAGHSYAFYSQATDFVGNIEPAKTSPDATTTVAPDGSCNGRPTLAGSVVSKSLAGSLETLTLQFTNNGVGNAPSGALNQITFRTLAGSGSVSLTNPAVPIRLGSIAAGASTNVTLTLNVPSTVKEFSMTENGNVQDLRGNTYNFSVGQAVFP